MSDSGGGGHLPVGAPHHQGDLPLPGCHSQGALLDLCPEARHDQPQEGAAVLQCLQGPACCLTEGAKACSVCSGGTALTEHDSRSPACQGLHEAS